MSVISSNHRWTMEDYRPVRILVVQVMRANFYLKRNMNKIPLESLQRLRNQPGG